MAEDLHLSIAARLTEKGPYKVLLDKEQADLWMKGSVTVAPPKADLGKWEGLGEIARIMAKEPEKKEISMEAAVFIVPRGSEEILWATETNDQSGWVSTDRGPREQIAKEIVRKLLKEKKRRK